MQRQPANPASSISAAVRAATAIRALMWCSWFIGSKPGIFSNILSSGEGFSLILRICCFICAADV